MFSLFKKKKKNGLFSFKKKLKFVFYFEGLTMDF